MDLYTICRVNSIICCFKINYSSIYRSNRMMQVIWQLEYNSAKSELPKLTDEYIKSLTNLMTSSNNGKQRIILLNGREYYGYFRITCIDFRQLRSYFYIKISFMRESKSIDIKRKKKMKSIVCQIFLFYIKVLFKNNVFIVLLLLYDVF
ncbi:hypothetical protein PUN28_000245 [Cardiocondyla obscurior]|uniref:Uncharacterized protein n=1 Tax=Cardiocondyla obscurior TaxID=286306 RepID=A0AAW2GYQ1_9HYME